MKRETAGSVESPRSWQAAFLTLAILSVSFGSPLLVMVGMRDMQAAMHTDRSVPSIASALVWIGSGLGGVPMGWLADRIGIRRTVMIGAVAMASGLALSSLGPVWTLYVGHGLLIGALGNGALYAPLIVYVSRWFDRRRGTAIALIASGQYIAGIIWPALIGVCIARFGWQNSMLAFAVVVLAAILPLVAWLGPPPQPAAAGALHATPQPGGRVLGLRPNVAMALICAASFLCCIPMALPASHLVAFCGDLGISAAHGAGMVSVLTGCAFISRQFWGLFADRYGGLRTVMTGSALQMLAIGAFMTTRNEAGLFAIAAAFGLGFSGLIPSYSVTIRDLFAPKEASWRIPTVLLTAMSGMAFGSWFAGWLYDDLGSYKVAFGSGVLFNLANLLVIVFLVSRKARQPQSALARATQ
jgi:MFS family permease